MKVGEQAGAELCQAQVKLKVIVVIGVKAEFEIVVEAGIQLSARVLCGRVVDGLKKIMVNLTQVEGEVEDVVELGNINTNISKI